MLLDLFLMPHRQHRDIRRGDDAVADTPHAGDIGSKAWTTITLASWRSAKFRAYLRAFWAYSTGSRW